MSRELAEQLLAFGAVNSHLPYHQLFSSVDCKVILPKRFKRMCRKGHMCATWLYANIWTCQVPSCRDALDLVRRLLYLYVSDYIKALLSAYMPFQEIYNGCERAKHSVEHSEGALLMDYLDGEMFRTLYGPLIGIRCPYDERFLFNTFSIDAFEIWDCRMNNRDTYRFILIILKFCFEHFFEHQFHWAVESYKVPTKVHFLYISKFYHWLSSSSGNGNGNDFSWRPNTKSVFIQSFLYSRSSCWEKGLGLAGPTIKTTLSSLWQALLVNRSISWNVCNPKWFNTAYVKTITYNNTTDLNQL